MKTFQPNDRVIVRHDNGSEVEGFVLLAYNERQQAAVIITGSNRTPIYVDYKMLTKID